MKKEDIFIPDSSYDGSDTLHHGKWSEEAKQRYREARKAGRSVYEMFAGYYNGLKKKTNAGLNKLANKTIYKNARAKVVKKMKATAAVRDKIAARRTAERQQSARTGVLSNHARLTKELNSANAKYKKLKKASTKKEKTGKILSDFAKAGLKSATKAGKDAVKASKKLARDVDRGITKAVNKHIEDKDRATQSKGERARIARKVAGARAQYNKVAQRSADADYTKQVLTGKVGRIDNLFGTKKAKKARAKADKKARITADKKVAEAMRDAREAEVTKNKYKSVGDMISKNVKKAKKSVSKTLKDINTNGGKGYTLSSKEIAAKKGKLVIRGTHRGDKSKYGVYKTDVMKRTKKAASLTDIIKGKTYEGKEYSSEMREYKLQSKRKPKRVKHVDSRSVYIPGKTGSSEEYLRHKF